MYKCVYMLVYVYNCVDMLQAYIHMFRMHTNQLPAPGLGFRDRHVCTQVFNTQQAPAAWPVSLSTAASSR